MTDTKQMVKICMNFILYTYPKPYNTNYPQYLLQWLFIRAIIHYPIIHVPSQSSVYIHRQIQWKHQGVDEPPKHCFLSRCFIFLLLGPMICTWQHSSSHSVTIIKPVGMQFLPEKPNVNVSYSICEYDRISAALPKHCRMRSCGAVDV